MITRTVDLYEYYELPKPRGAEGKLTCLVQRTAPEIVPRRKRPGVLILPGGAYRFTSDREAAPVALRFMARGYGAFILRYTCAPACFPVQLRESCMAMRYIREHAEEFELDTHMIAAIGFSAGGHLCGTLGTMYDCPEVTDLGGADLLRPDVLGLCYPVTVNWGKTHTETFENVSGNDPALASRLSLDALVRPDMPPVFLWHTRDDVTVPCRNSLVLASALEAAEVEFALYLYRQGRHGASTADEMVYPMGEIPAMSRDVPGWLESMLRFFGEIGFGFSDLS